MQSVPFPELLEPYVDAERAATFLALPISDFTEPETPDLPANPIRHRRDSETRFRK
jgi:hypothetical protein